MCGGYLSISDLFSQGFKTLQYKALRAIKFHTTGIRYLGTYGIIYMVYMAITIESNQITSPKETFINMLDHHFISLGTVVDQFSLCLKTENAIAWYFTKKVRGKGSKFCYVRWLRRTHQIMQESPLRSKRHQVGD